jgi:hypothetical protein
MTYFHLIIGAFFSLMFAGSLLTVALSDIPALKRDKLGAALAFIAGGLLSALPFIVAAEMYIHSIK